VEALKQLIRYFEGLLAPLTGRTTAHVLCSECFQDQGLTLDADQIGIDDHRPCKNCGAKTGRKLTRELVETLAHRFFVWGTMERFLYGAAPLVQFNDQRSSEIDVSPWLEPDLRLIERIIGVGFFYYGPRLWMIGEEIEPLNALLDPKTRRAIIDRIIAEYPNVTLTANEFFYWIRKAPAEPAQCEEYDSPPLALSGENRFDSKSFSVMYGSQDLQVCIHECRVTAEDELFVATLAPAGKLKLLDLTHLLEEEVTEFESLDIAVHMLFLAGQHSYEICRAIAHAIQRGGYDGIIYPSYFSLLRTGAMPFETAYGISLRRIGGFSEYERSKIIPNLAVFGRPIEEGKVTLRCINRLILNRVEYGAHFGPVSY